MKVSVPSVVEIPADVTFRISTVSAVAPVATGVIREPLRPVMQLRHGRQRGTHIFRCFADVR